MKTATDLSPHQLNKNREFYFPKSIPADTNIDELQDMADLLEFIGISRKSKASQKEVDGLAKAASKGRWEKTKAKLGL